MAILLVVVGHSAVPWMPNGSVVGVTLFFVLSGYLITGLLLRDLAGGGRIAVGAFWRRRTRRLLPALAIFLPAASLVLLLRSGGDLSVLWLVALTPLMDVVRGAMGNQWTVGHLWSLAVEEQFYLLWPLVLPRLRSTGALWKRLATVAAWLTLWHCLLVAVGLVGWAYFGPDANAYALVLGGALAAFLGTRKPRVSGVAAFGALVVILAIAAAPLPGLAVLIQPVAAAAGAVLIAGAASLPPMAWAPLRYAGGVSYGWYLWHLPLVELSQSKGLGLVLVADVASLGIAAMSFHLVESRFMSVRAQERPRAVGPAR
jgi:peptidoglycan/LPS O-acetylase OafA/YrhL